MYFPLPRNCIIIAYPDLCLVMNHIYYALTDKVKYHKENFLKPV
jgi:hypothetical protein